MPPGTGDIQLTLIQKMKLDGVVIVTTPQEIALIDARRAASMFEKTATPILGVIEAAGHRPRAVYRRQGDRHLLVEYGPIVLDLELRLRIHALMLELQTMALPGVIDITPGIRSLQVHYDSRVLSQAELLRALTDAEDRLGGLDDFEIPSRVVHLPLSWKDPAIYETIDKYMASVRDLSLIHI